MIGQHIYSRCLEGYFSKSGVNADSTTVTISMDMFAREDQAKRVARECESISTLEDIRSVPTETQGAYRGVLKIFRISRQITVVCRSYRLHSEQNNTGGGESRDFTYSSSYILTGEDKERFFESPEYCLNIQDFEPYPSVMNRIKDSRMRGNGGRIEANEKYSLFRSKCKEALPQIFEQAGFNRELFVDYISSIIQRISYSHYSGHEKDKVLVVLPEQYNKPWDKCGGNAYAEEVLVATLKLLPECVREQLNATTGGMHDPDAFVLEGYQLVFMEPGNIREWKQSEYSIIDLNQKESYVSEDLDRTYGEFIWNHLFEREVCRDFEKQYEELFDEKKDGNGDHSPEKFGLLLDLLQERNNSFSDGRKRAGMLQELIDYGKQGWTDKLEKYVEELMKAELQHPGYMPVLEETWLEILQQEMCPERLKPLLITGLLQDILNGEASQENIQWICNGIKSGNTVICQKTDEADQYVQNNKNIAWYNRKSLLDMYLKICGDSEIAADTKIKNRILAILSDWYMGFLEKNDWKNSIMVVCILAEQLEDPQLEEIRRQEIYQDLLYLLFFGEGEGRKQISDIIKKEEKTFGSYPHNLELFRKCFERQIQETDIMLNEDVLWQMTYLAVSGDFQYLQGTWREIHAELLRRFGSQNRELPEKFNQYFINWIQNIQDEQKKDLVYTAILIAEQNNLEYESLFHYIDLNELRKTSDFLAKSGRKRMAGKLLYEFYLKEDKLQEKKQLFSEFNPEEQWEILLIYCFSNDQDKLLNAAKQNLYQTKKEFFQIATDFKLKEEEIKKIAEIYLELCDKEVEKSKKKANELNVWCGILREEIRWIQTITEGNSFSNLIIKEFRQRMACSNPVSILNLNMGDVLFLKNKGVLPLGEEWGQMDVIAELYSADPNMYSEEFVNIREKMIMAEDTSLKKIYLDALIKKEESLGINKEPCELVYNVVLLKEQMQQDVTGNDRLSLENITRNITGSNSDKKKLQTALALMGVIQSYGSRRDYGVYNCGQIRNQLKNEIFRIAKSDVQVFADAQILKLYKRVSGKDNLLIEQMGIKDYFKELPTEWQNKYGIREARSGAEIIIPGIFAGVFLLLGIGLEVFFFKFGSIRVQTAMITGMILTAVGVFGDIVTMIILLFSLNN